MSSCCAGPSVFRFRRSASSSRPGSPPSAVACSRTSGCLRFARRFSRRRWRRWPHRSSSPRPGGRRGSGGSFARSLSTRSGRSSRLDRGPTSVGPCDPHHDRRAPSHNRPPPRRRREVEVPRRIERNSSPPPRSRRAFAALSPGSRRRRPRAASWSSCRHSRSGRWGRPTWRQSRRPSASASSGAASCPRRARFRVGG